MNDPSPKNDSKGSESFYAAVLDRPPEEELIGAEMRELAEQHRQQFFKGYFKLGKRAQKALQLADSNFSGVSSEQNLEQLASDANVHPQLLRDCLKIVATYSWSEYRALFARREISWPHIVNLACLNSKAQRDRFTELTCSQCWSPDQLARAIVGQNPTEKKKRISRSPANIRVALDRLHSYATKYLETTGRLFSETYDLATHIRRTPPNEITEGHRAQASEAILDLQKVARQAAGDAEYLQQGLDWIDQVLRVRAADDGGLQ